MINFLLEKKFKNPTFLLILFIGLSVLELQAQQSINSQSVFDAKKRIAQQLKANNTTCTWDTHRYKEKRIDGKIGLYTSDGKEIIPPQFKDILGPPYSWFVPVKKAGADKYSLFNLAGTQLAESAYYRVVPISNNKCGLDATAGAYADCCGDTYSFSVNYLCSYYLASDSISRFGLFNSDYDVLLPFEYAKITHGGGSRFITSKDIRLSTYELIDVETQKTLLKDVKDIKVFFVNKSKPTYVGRITYLDRDPYYAVRDSGKWKMLSPDLSPLLPKVYDALSVQDSFIIARENQMYDLYSCRGDLLVSESERYITNVISSPKDFVYVTEKVENYTQYQTLTHIADVDCSIKIGFIYTI